MEEGGLGPAPAAVRLHCHRGPDGHDRGGSEREHHRQHQQGARRRHLGAQQGHACAVAQEAQPLAAGMGAGTRDLHAVSRWLLCCHLCAWHRRPPQRQHHAHQGRSLVSYVSHHAHHLHDLFHSAHTHNSSHMRIRTHTYTQAARIASVPPIKWCFCQTSILDTFWATLSRSLA